MFKPCRPHCSKSRGSEHAADERDIRHLIASRRKAPAAACLSLCLHAAAAQAELGESM